jgi:hypothetical protein
MTVEQKFSSHLVSEQHHVRQATSKFKDFALIWWNELATLGLQPHTWDGLKIAMRQRFVPPSYQRDLCKKLQHLDQGDMSVQDYYAELQKGLIRVGVHKETEDKIYHFYGGLRTEIQDIVDYKEYNNVNHLFQLAMLAEKELQGQQLIRLKSSFMPHHTSTTPSTSRAPATPLRRHLRLHVHLSHQWHHHQHLMLQRWHHQHLVQQQNRLHRQPHPPVAPPILSATIVME